MTFEKTFLEKYPEFEGKEDFTNTIFLSRAKFDRVVLKYFLSETIEEILDKHFVRKEITESIRKAKNMVLDKQTEMMEKFVKDYKQDVKDAIDNIMRQCEIPKHNELRGSLLILKKELGLE